MSGRGGMPLKRFLQLWVPVACILLAGLTAVTVYMYAYSPLMDIKFGEGKRLVYGGIQSDADYYDAPYDSLEGAVENARKVTYDISSEGIVLLKNNGVLPLEKGESVTPFGYHYLNPNYQPSSGSAVVGENDNISAEEVFGGLFKVNDAVVNEMKAATPYGLTRDALFLRTDDRRADIIEFDPAIYHGTEASCRGSVGIVFIGRTGGEGTGGEGTGGDMLNVPLYDGTAHGAALSVFERKTIAFAKANCEKVVVVLNCCNTMQIASLASGEYEADAILWIGGPGSTGFKALGDILTGRVNPSGRLPDIYVRDETRNPTYVNYGDGFRYANVNTDEYYHIYNTFVEYEEGVYYGYRYYETACVEDDEFVYGELDGRGAVTEEGEVLYPFGYGLSYTAFEKSISDFECDGETVEVSVKVTNRGGVPGKEAVQVYYTPPYTSFSAENGIEKPAVTLAGFGKTRLLSPGQSDYVKISFAVEDMASWFAARDNGDGTSGCYFLEKGEYMISLRDNSHTVIEGRRIAIDADIYYDRSNPRQSDAAAQGGEDIVAASNRFSYLTQYMNGQTEPLTRAEWKATQPSQPSRFTAPDYVLDEFENTRIFDPETDAALGNVSGSRVYDDTPVTSRADNGVVLSDLRGRPYDDAMWNALLDNADYGAEDFIKAFQAGYMSLGSVKSVGLPAVQLRDGPLGIKATGDEISMGVPTVHNCYSATPVLAATFNRALAYEYGEAVAQEALLHNGGNLPVSFIYAPALNIHRGPFGGRYYEYFSEDPVLTGYMAAEYMCGTAENGLFSVLKHFAVNNQDLARDGLNTWLTEQTLREIYLRPFEICIKTARATIKYIDGDGSVRSAEIPAAMGVMTAKNNIGATFCGANAALLYDVLRTEWGFDGFIICDFITGKNNRLYQKMVRSGVNIIMAFTPQNGYGGTDCNTGRHILREGLHRVCYAVCNSNAMQGVPPGGIVKYGMPAWKIVLAVADGTAAAAVAAMVLITVCRYKKRKNDNS